jgi:hypothetical protein
MTTPARSRDQRSARIDNTSPRPSLYPMDYEPVAARPRGVRLVGPDRRGVGGGTGVPTEFSRHPHRSLI